MHPDFVLQQGTPDLLGSISGLTPAQVSRAYGINLVNFNGITGDGAGQTIAIVDAYNAPSIRSDLHTFDQQFGLPDPQLTIINQAGGSTLPTTDPAGPGFSWAVEISLDVEWAHAVAPGANILLVLATSNSNSDLEAAILTARAGAGVSVVSMSFGSDEVAGDRTSNNDFTTPTGHTGVTFIASAGDNGAFGTSTAAKVTSFPASSPNVVAIGGTRLNLANGSYGSETGWGAGQSSGVTGGGGGGISKIQSQPTYQKGVVTQTSIFRAAPDVAFDADPASGVAVIDSWDSPSSPWTVVGGTSLAAPMWAGVMAITNQGRTLAGEGTMDGATQTLPALYKLPQADFHDITVGNNGYSALPGYDLVTGRGTPIVNLVVRDLVTPPGSIPVVVNGPVIGSLSVTPSSTAAGANVTLSANNVAELGNGTLSSVKFYAETNGTPGYQSGADTLLGTGTQDGSTWNFTLSTSNITASGSYTYYAIATDSATLTSNVAAQALTILAPTFTVGVKADSVTQLETTVNATPTTAVTLEAVVTAGTPLALTASNVQEEGGTIVSVRFTRTLYAAGGVLTPGAPTVNIGTGVQSGSDWTVAASTLSLAPGFYNFSAIATDSAGISSTVTVVVEVVSVPLPPPNDSIFNAINLTGVSVSTTGTNVSATVGTDTSIIGFNFENATDPAAVAGVAGGRSVWWTWTAPVSGKVALSTGGSSFDSLLGVYTGTLVLDPFTGILNLALTPVAVNDDISLGVKTSGLTFDTVVGASYYIDVDGFHGASGTINLNLSETPAGSTSSFATPQVLTGNTGTYTGSNTGRSSIIGQPKIAGKQGGGQVWFTWTATSTRTVHLDTLGSGFDTLLGVFKGNALTALTKIAANDDANGSTLASALTFKATKGVTYRFAIDGYLGANGNYVLNMS